MSGTPSVASPNRFSCLYNESANIHDSNEEMIDVPSTVETPQPPELRPRKPRWERKLPKCYTVAATSGSNSLFLPLEIQSTENAVQLSMTGLVDCGATSDFINAGLLGVDILFNGYTTCTPSLSPGA